MFQVRKRKLSIKLEGGPWSVKRYGIEFLNGKGGFTLRYQVYKLNLIMQ